MTNPILPSSVNPSEIKMVKQRRFICAYCAAKAAEGSAESSAGRISLAQMYLCKIPVGHRAVKEINGQRTAYSGKQFGCGSAVIIAWCSHSHRAQSPDHQIRLQATLVLICKYHTLTGTRTTTDGI